MQTMQTSRGAGSLSSHHHVLHPQLVPRLAQPQHLSASLPANAHAPCFPRSPLQAGSPAPRSPLQASSPAPRGGVVAAGLARKVLAQKGIEGDPLAFLDVSEAFWRALRNQKHEPEKKGKKVVRYAEGLLFPDATSAAPSDNDEDDGPAGAAAAAASTPHDFDVVICGGTLGLFLATALQLRGWRICIVEKRLVQGRNQEWNISWGELEVLVDLGLLTREELRECVVSEFNPIRVGFLGGEDVWTSDVLNLGVQPRLLLNGLRRRFLGAGGVIHENTAFKKADIHADGLRLTLAPGGNAEALAVGDTNRPNGLTPGGAPPSAWTAPRSMSTRLLLDCMGHYSDIVKQIRGRVKPDGMCMVVGSCATGFPSEQNISADLLYSLSHARHDMQLFWEAFPAEGGTARTTYMFAYSDAHPERPGFEQLLDTYFELLPSYQGLPVDQLHFKRVLFGGFPCYSNGPLQPAFDRVMQIGDASASQSPLSFGGFGSMMRHLSRLTRGVDQALSQDRLAKSDLKWLQPYQPSLSASWLFQRSMSIGVGQAAYPPAYAHAPPYAYDDAVVQPYDAEAARQMAAAAGMAEVPIGLGAGAGPAGAFQEAVAMAAARFAAGAADPADYLHVDSDNESSSDSSGFGMMRGGGVAGVASKLERQAAVAKEEAARRAAKRAAAAGLHERDFRGAAEWMRLPYSHVNEILGCNFGVMGILGDRVLRPFLQDTIQLGPLSLSMVGMMLANPVTVSRVLLQVGPKTLVSWFGHYAALWAFTLGHLFLSPLRGLLPDSYLAQRLLDQLEYGSGSDFRYHQGPEVAPPPQIKAAAEPASLTDGSEAAEAAAAAPVAAVPEPMGSKRQ